VQQKVDKKLILEVEKEAQKQRTYSKKEKIFDFNLFFASHTLSALLIGTSK